MSTAFVLGNGTSRRGISAAALRQWGIIYGCNALYREYTPDVLVATDLPIARAIQSSGYALTNRFYTRRPEPDSGALRLDSRYSGFSSGPNAMALAALDGHGEIYLLGFDMGPSADNRINNLYTDTEFYRPSTAEPVHVGSWVTQMVTVATDFPDVQFYRVMGNATASITEFRAIKNFHSILLSELLSKFK